MSNTVANKIKHFPQLFSLSQQILLKLKWYHFLSWSTISTKLGMVYTFKSMKMLIIARFYANYLFGHAKIFDWILYLKKPFPYQAHSFQYLHPFSENFPDTAIIIADFCLSHCVNIDLNNINTKPRIFGEAKRYSVE